MSSAVTDEVAALELKQVSVSYPAPRGERVRVLAEANVIVRAGRMTCVAGRSGSGKTTLLYVAAGLLAPDSGRVLWRGREVQAISADAQARERRGFIGFVFQGAELIPSLTAAENVALVRGRDGRRIADGRLAAELLDRFGLAERAGNLPHQLSGGEQQRVAVARALVADPPVILLDEPTAFLDRQTGDGIIKLLIGLRAEGRALLVASHDEHVIAAADRLVRLDQRQSFTTVAISRTTALNVGGTYLTPILGTRRARTRVRQQPSEVRETIEIMLGRRYGG